MIFIYMKSTVSDHRKQQNQETFFVKKELLEGWYLDMLENVQLEKGKIEQLEIVKERREIAQYSAMASF